MIGGILAPKKVEIGEEKSHLYDQQTPNNLEHFTGEKEDEEKLKV